MKTAILQVLRVSVAFLVMSVSAEAEPFKEVTIGLPVTSLSEGEAWYSTFLGTEVEIVRPTPDIVEFKVAPGVWLQLFQSKAQQTSGSVLRFLVDDIEATQRALAAAGIDSGEAIAVPDVVTFSEFTDPDGNALGLYSLPSKKAE